MATVYDCALLARAAYGEVPAPSDWRPVGASQMATWNPYDGFQGMTFAKGNTVVFAFKGTALVTRSMVGDIVADLKLGVGMNTVQFAQAYAYVEKTMPVIPAGSRVYLCGHSLGGAIAQIVGNRMRLPFVTFNAPGVGVIAGNIGDLMTQTPQMSGLRLAGSVVSAVRHPVQALRDAASLFYLVQGNNLRLSTDPVSMIGIHYGKVTTLPYSGGIAHGIDEMITTLKGTDTGKDNLEGSTGR